MNVVVPVDVIFTPFLLRVCFSPSFILSAFLQPLLFSSSEGERIHSSSSPTAPSFSGGLEISVATGKIDGAGQVLLFSLTPSSFEVIC
jgi:hypothetical protein